MFFLMIRRPPRSTPLSLHDALPIWAGRGNRRDGGRDAGAAVIAIRDTLSGELRELEPREEGRGGIYACGPTVRSEEHTSELQSRQYLVCRLLFEKKKKKTPTQPTTI